MTLPQSNSTIGVLASGGLDSCILIAHLLERGRRVYPIYVRCGLVWEAAELAGLKAFLRAAAAPRLEKLVVLEMPLGDLYQRHWSLDGRDAPGAETPAGAVYLPGRNALLTIKPAIWCGARGIEELALAVLDGNPFADATAEFFRELETTLRCGTGNRLSIVRPFAEMKKADVLRLGRGLPLALTFSCICPIDGRHCGACNKCAERRKAFRILEMADPTQYNQCPMTSDQ